MSWALATSPAAASVEAAATEPPIAAPPVPLPPGTQMLAEEFFPGTTDWEDVPLDEKSGVTLRVLPVRYNVVAPAPIAVRLEAIDRGGKRRPIPSARLRLGRRDAPDAPTYEVAFVDDGVGEDKVAGDHSYTATLQPDARQGKALLGRVYLEVSAKFPEGVRTIPGTLIYTVGPRARLTGTWHDALKNGSLSLEAELDVEEAGVFTLIAQIFGPSLEPIAWVKQTTPLGAGRGVIALEVFGKALSDAGIDGPYRVRQVLLSRDHDSEYEPGVTIEEAYRTHAYLAQDFSPAPYVEPPRQVAEVTADDPSQRDTPPALGTRAQR